MDNFKPIQAESLSNEEAKIAASDLYKNITNYQKVNRRFCDPIKPEIPKFALFTFIKSPNIQPDSDGFFGVAKIRGAYNSSEDAQVAAEEIIKHVDSTNSVYTCLMGVPFPLVCKGYSSELSEVDLREKTEEVISKNVRLKRDQDKKEIEELKEREQNLHKDVSTDKDPEDIYIENRVKLAHLKYMIQEHTSKLKECSELKIKCSEFLKKECSEHPEFEKNYLDRYMSSRRKANVPENTDMEGFMKFIADEID